MAVYGRRDAAIEQVIVQEIEAKTAVFNSENHRKYRHQQRPLFAFNVTTPQYQEHTLSFFNNDSSQFAMQRFYQQHQYKAQDLFARDTLLSAIHRQKIMYMRQSCTDTSDTPLQCSIQHCKRFAPIFPGYEHEKSTNMYKNTIVLAHAYRSRVEDCVETGTYQGTTTLLLAKEVCKRVYTIELSHKFATKAQERFQSELDLGKKYATKITLVEGDSGQVLSANPIFTELKRTLWFLDGHYSYLDTARGEDDSPLMKELEFILTREGGKEDVVLVDDAREFRGNRFPASPGDASVEVLVYPELKQVIGRICELAPEALVDLVDDVLVVRQSV